MKTTFSKKAMSGKQKQKKQPAKWANNETDIREGKRIYVRVCVGCAPQANMIICKHWGECVNISGKRWLSAALFHQKCLRNVISRNAYLSYQLFFRHRVFHFHFSSGFRTVCYSQITCPTYSLTHKNIIPIDYDALTKCETKQASLNFVAAAAADNS